MQAITFLKALGMAAAIALSPSPGFAQERGSRLPDIRIDGPVRDYLAAGNNIAVWNLSRCGAIAPLPKNSAEDVFGAAIRPHLSEQDRGRIEQFLASDEAALAKAKGAQFMTDALAQYSDGLLQRACGSWRSVFIDKYAQTVATWSRALLLTNQAGDPAPETLTLVAELVKQAVFKCWSPLPNSKATPRFILSLKHDGNLASWPVLLNSSDDPSFAGQTAGAVRAIMKCAPFTSITIQPNHKQWREIVVQFPPIVLSDPPHSSGPLSGPAENSIAN